ncbi:MAG: hypothetical protein QNL04_12940 [SAR324 cluster bacterium]|nr:hypothetical protein [SAR324 cluster bacterium]
MFQKVLVPCFFLITLLNASSLFAQSSQTGGYFALGYSNSGQSVGVQSKETGEQGDLNTENYDRSSSGLFVKYSSRPNLFSNGGFGYNYILNYSQVNVTGQIVTGGGADSSSDTQEVLNLGTSAKGKGVFIIPTLFYLWGDSSLSNYFMIGFGLGIGSFAADGDLYLTENTQSSNPDCYTQKRALSIEGIKTYCEKKAFDYSGLGKASLAFSINIDKKWDHALLGLSVKGINASDDENNYTFGDIAVNLGLAF